MQGVNEFGGPWCFWHPVKNITVGYVFKQCPEKHTAEENQQDGFGAVIVPGGCQVNDIGKYGNVHAPNHQRMGLGQRFQEVAFK